MINEFTEQEIESINRAFADNGLTKNENSSALQKYQKKLSEDPEERARFEKSMEDDLKECLKQENEHP